MRAIILGCGPSGGVPVIGGDWGNCDPNNARNRRLRASILVQQAGANLLVDTSPDLRAQLLAAEIDRVDAVLFTHAHADHVHGIDELRPVNRAMGRPIPVYAASEVMDELKVRFHYVFTPLNPAAGSHFYKPVLIPHIFAGQFMAAGVSVLPFRQDHGFGVTYGFRFGNLAYTTDAVGLDEAAFQALDGVKVWIVDCFRRTAHPTHSHLARTLDWIARVNPSRAVLTHMDGQLDYEVLCQELPAGIQPAYDGMRIEI